jgi:FkbM family methyltransferase
MLNYFLQFCWELLPQEAHDRIFTLAYERSEQNLFKTVKQSGFYPETIIDVGAYEGEWAAFISDYFPKSDIILIEAQKEKKKILEDLDFTVADIHIETLSDKSGKTVEFYQHETGSSYYRENTDVDIPKKSKQTVTLDELINTSEVENALLKLDVQGAELDILNGGREILESTTAVYLECSLVNYNVEGPLIEEVISYIRGQGFTPYGIGGYHRWGNQLSQIDLLFIDEKNEIANEWKRELNSFLK